MAKYVEGNVTDQEYNEVVSFLLNNKDPAKWAEYFDARPGLLEKMYNNFGDYFLNVMIGIAQYKAANGLDNTSYEDVSKLASTYYNDNSYLNPYTEKYLDNQTARTNTQIAQDFEQQMRDTSYLSAGNQLQQLGLSTSGVLQTGGALSNGVGAPATNMHSASATKQQEAINRYNNKIALAKSAIGMVSQMASAGIYGGAIGAAKKAGGILASSAAHSASAALSGVNHRNWDAVKAANGTFKVDKDGLLDLTQF